MKELDSYGPKREWSLVGSCPACGGPIYARPGVNAPPEVHRSCDCKFVKRMDGPYTNEFRPANESGIT